jgi:SAM-dependent methyltransferase
VVVLELAPSVQASLRCPLCRSDILIEADRIVCANHGPVGTLHDGVVDFEVRESGLARQLISFWHNSSAYHAATQAAHAEVDDRDHATHRRLIGALPASSRLVLDVGCGTAETATLVRRECPDASYVGVDASLQAVLLARGLERPGTFIRADGDRLPFADETFDGVVSFFALEHFTSPREVLEEMSRVLRRGGVLVLLSVSYDRPLGVVPSQRFGATRAGQRLPRLHPVNLAAYAKNRGVFIGRQLLKHARYRIDPGYVSFDQVERPLALDIPYEQYSDSDAVHLVSGTSVVRVLERGGLEIIETTVPRPGRLRIPWAMIIVARRR